MTFHPKRADFYREDQDRAIAFMKDAATFHARLLLEAEKANDPVIEQAWRDAAHSFDNWYHDDVTLGVLGIIEEAEADAAPADKEQSELLAWHRGRVL